ncbi:MAG: molybdenum cofactor biosynthesis protein [Desulfobacteraceae bacterium]|jgi:molybdopterin synthase catalytic subunit|nr:MAG: molybdenum cofactor biosynthesis protein [Desulfobacteraceae bacterium]
MKRTFDIGKIIASFKAHERYARIGMIATHLGIVRGDSRKGGAKVTAVEVAYDRNKISNIVKDIENMPGIVKVVIDVNEGYLKTGEEIMMVAVGGDIREHVFHALEMAVNRIKKEASRKKEFFAEKEAEQWV